MQFPVQGGKITEFKMGFTLERVAKYLLFLMAFFFFFFQLADIIIILFTLFSSIIQIMLLRLDNYHTGSEGENLKWYKYVGR